MHISVSKIVKLKLERTFSIPEPVEGKNDLGRFCNESKTGDRFGPCNPSYLEPSFEKGLRLLLLVPVRCPH